MLKRISLFAASLLFLTAGTLHCLRTAVFAKIVPPWLPAPRLLVYSSGIAEIAGGAALLLKPLRRPAAWGLVALLIAVFPANLYMATHHIQVTNTHLSPWLLWARLPVQGLLIWWILWTTRRSGFPSVPGRDIVVEDLGVL